MPLWPKKCKYGDQIETLFPPVQVHVLLEQAFPAKSVFNLQVNFISNSHNTS